MKNTLKNAPMIMIPSSAMLMTPLRSENIPPNATTIKGTMNKSEFWKMK